MLDATSPGGPTPISNRLQEIHSRISYQYRDLRERRQRVVLVIATDGLPTSAYSGTSTAHDMHVMVELLKRLGTELSVFIVIRLTADDDDVVAYYNKVDEELELP